MSATFVTSVPDTTTPPDDTTSSDNKCNNNHSGMMDIASDTPLSDDGFNIEPKPPSRCRKHRRRTNKHRSLRHHNRHYDRLFEPADFQEDNINGEDLHTNSDDVPNDDVFHDCFDNYNLEVLHPYLDIGCYTVCTYDYSVFSVPPTGTAHAHGEQIYTHTSGQEFRVFVTESKDDGSSPQDHKFWSAYLSQDTVSRHIYQGIVDYCAEYDINATEVDDVLDFDEPKFSTPKPIDHAAMRLFFCWLPIKRILDTFKYTSQMMRAPSSTYLQKRHRSPHPAANIIRRNDNNYTDTVFSDTLLSIVELLVHNYLPVDVQNLFLFTV